MIGTLYEGSGPKAFAGELGLAIAETVFKCWAIDGHFMALDGADIESLRDDYRKAVRVLSACVRASRSFQRLGGNIESIATRLSVVREYALRAHVVCFRDSEILRAQTDKRKAELAHEAEIHAARAEAAEAKAEMFKAQEKYELEAKEQRKAKEEHAEKDKRDKELSRIEEAISMLHNAIHQEEEQTRDTVRTEAKKLAGRQRGLAGDYAWVECFKRFDAEQKEQAGTQIETMGGVLAEMKTEGYDFGNVGARKAVDYWRTWAGMGRPQSGEAYAKAKAAKKAARRKPRRAK